MEHKPNATCRVCGKPYYVCRECAHKLKQQYGSDSWRAVAETPTHYQVFLVCVMYGREPEKIDEYRASLERLNLDDIDTYLPAYQRMVREILSSGEPAPAKPTEAPKEDADSAKAQDARAEVIYHPSSYDFTNGSFRHKGKHTR